MHEIQNLTIDLSIYPKDSRIVQFFQNKFPTILESILDEIFGINEFVIIEDVSFDFSEDLFDVREEALFEQKVKVLLRNAFNKIPNNKKKQVSNLALVLFYLEKGYHKFQNIDDKALIKEVFKNNSDELISSIYVNKKSEILIGRLFNVIDKYNLHSDFLNYISTKSRDVNSIYSKVFIVGSNEAKSSYVKIVLNYLNPKNGKKTIPFKNYFRTKLYLIKDAKSINTRKLSQLLGVKDDIDNWYLSSIYEELKRKEILDLKETLSFDQIVKWLINQDLLTQLDAESFNIIHKIAGPEVTQKILDRIGVNEITANISDFVKWVYFIGQTLNIEGHNVYLKSYLLNEKKAFSDNNLIKGFIAYIKQVDVSVYQFIAKYLESIVIGPITNQVNTNFNRFNVFAFNYVFTNAEDEYNSTERRLIAYLRQGLVLQDKFKEKYKEQLSVELTEKLQSVLSELAFSKEVMIRVADLTSPKRFFNLLPSLWTSNTYAQEFLNKIKDSHLETNDVLFVAVNEYILDNLGAIAKLSSEKEVDAEFKKVSKLWEEVSLTKKAAKESIDLDKSKSSEDSLYAIMEKWSKGNEDSIQEKFIQALENTLQTDITKIIRYIKELLNPTLVLKKLLERFKYESVKPIVDLYFKDDEAYRLLNDQMAQFNSNEMASAVLENFLNVRNSRALKISIANDKDEIEAKKHTRFDTKYELKMWLNYYLVSKKSLYHKSKVEEIIARILTSDANFILKELAKLSKKELRAILAWLVQFLSVPVSLKLVLSLYGDENGNGDQSSAFKKYVSTLNSVEEKKLRIRNYVFSEGNILASYEQQSDDNADRLVELSNKYELYLQYLTSGIWESNEYELDEIQQYILQFHLIDLARFVIKSKLNRIYLLRLIFQMEVDQLSTIFLLIYEKSEGIEILRDLATKKQLNDKFIFKLIVDLFDNSIYIRDVNVLTEFYNLIKEEDDFINGVSSKGILVILIDIISQSRLTIESDIDVLESIKDKEFKKILLIEYIKISFNRFSYLLKEKEVLSSKVLALYYSLNIEDRNDLWLNWSYSSNSLPFNIKAYLAFAFKNELNFVDIESNLLLEMSSNLSIKKQDLFYDNKILNESIISPNDLQKKAFHFINENNFIELFEVLIFPVHLYISESTFQQISTYIKRLGKSELNEIARLLVKKNVLDSTYYNPKLFEEFSKKDLLDFINYILNSKLAPSSSVHAYFTQLVPKNIDSSYPNNDVESSLYLSSLYNRLITDNDFVVLQFLSIHKYEFIKWLLDNRLFNEFILHLHTIIGSTRTYEWISEVYIKPYKPNVLQVYEINEYDSISNQNDDLTRGDSNSPDQAISDVYVSNPYNELITYIIHSYDNKSIDVNKVAFLVYHAARSLDFKLTQFNKLYYQTNKLSIIVFLFNELHEKVFFSILKVIEPTFFFFHHSTKPIWIEQHSRLVADRILSDFYNLQSLDIYFQSTTHLSSSEILKIISHRFQKQFLINKYDLKSGFPSEWKLDDSLFDTISINERYTKDISSIPRLEYLANRLTLLLRSNIDIESFGDLIIGNVESESRFSILNNLLKEIRTYSNEIDIISNWVNTLRADVVIDLIYNWIINISDSYIRDQIKRLYPTKFYLIDVFNELSKKIPSIPNLMNTINSIVYYSLLLKKNATTEISIIEILFVYLKYEQLFDLLTHFKNLDTTSLSSDESRIVNSFLQKSTMLNISITNDTIVNDILEIGIDNESTNAQNDHTVNEFDSLLNQISLIIKNSTNYIDKLVFKKLWTNLAKIKTEQWLIGYLSKQFNLIEWTRFITLLTTSKIIPSINEVFSEWFPDKTNAVKEILTFISKIDLVLTRSELETRIWTVVLYEDKLATNAELLKVLINTFNPSQKQLIRLFLYNSTQQPTASSVEDAPHDGVLDTDAPTVDKENVDELTAFSDEPKSSTQTDSEASGESVGNQKASAELGEGDTGEVQDNERVGFERRDVPSDPTLAKKKAFISSDSIDDHEMQKMRKLEQELFDFTEKLIHDDFEKEQEKEQEQESILKISPSKTHRLDRSIIRDQLFSYMNYGHFQNTTVIPIQSFSNWLKNLDQLFRNEKSALKKRISLLAKHQSFIESVKLNTSSDFKMWLLEWLLPNTVNNSVVEKNIIRAENIVLKRFPNWSKSDLVTSFIGSFLSHFMDQSSINLSAWVDKIVEQEQRLTDDEIAFLDGIKPARTSTDDSSSIIEKIARNELVVEDEPVEGLIHLPYAGIVLFGPYLSRLFDLLGYLKENKKSFQSVDKACRAVYALALLNGKNEAMNEPEYLIHKLLCGLPLAIPLPPKPEFTDTELSTVNSMLNGVKNNWPKMQRSSVEAMQQSFINRDGTLSYHDTYWQVTIEKQTMDILLQSIPWSYAKIKLPWMDLAINVEWI